MQISGFQKNSFIDYPGKISAVVFCGGCNYNCWYCHNRELICPEAGGYSESEVMEFLDSRKGVLDAVVFSGGEALLQPDLAEIMLRVKDMGYLVKLDTNGSDPSGLEKLIEAGLVDYVAMDIKAPAAKYSDTVCTEANIEDVKRSISVIMSSGIAYEFRTTCVPQFSPEDVREMAKMIRGAKLYVLQQYVHNDSARHVTGVKLRPHEKEFFAESRKLARRYVERVSIKGIDIT